MDFSGKLAIVTGAANGIGAATSRLLLSQGASVFAVDMDRDGLEVLRAGLETTSCPTAPTCPTTPRSSRW